ncbi:MAG: ferritin-like domain-containing protein [Alphaproteobacteria bacterium]|nr:ferritin-like domain-containing protein [Alphaproteobacteria bacterium]
MIPLRDLPLTTPLAPRRSSPELVALRRRFLAAILSFSGVGLPALTGCTWGSPYDCTDTENHYYDITAEYYLQDGEDTCPVIGHQSAFLDNEYDYGDCEVTALQDQSENEYEVSCTYTVHCPEFETSGWNREDLGTDCADAESVEIESLVIEDRERSELAHYYDDDYYDTCRNIELVDQDGAICTYEMECQPWSCCGYGRPYLDHDAQPVTTEVSDDPSWRVPVAVDVDALTAQERDALAAFWLKNAAAEHSSVAGFHRFALDLLAHGAPPELLLAAQRAASQEVQHAIDCFSLASRYAGTTRGPAPMPLGESAPVAGSLAALAVWTVRDGAVGETIAAWLAARALERATDPVVREKLAIIVRDETEHAELAWKTLAWAVEQGGDEVRRAIMACINSVDPEPVSEAWTSPALVAHGLLPAEEQTAAVRRCLEEVIRPVAASLLARSLAA